jgi:hypothetical protein
MPNPPPLWGDPEPSNIMSKFVPAASVGAKRLAKHQERYGNWIDTDLIAWLKQNDPLDFAELMDLRKALYSLKSRGKYRIELQGITQGGEQKIKLTGPVNAVLIVSNKSRHYLLRVLCRLRIIRDWPPIKY